MHCVPTDSDVEHHRSRASTPSTADAPAAIALLLIVWGTLASVSSVQSPATAADSRVWRIAGIGAALALYVFMADSLRAAPHGLQAVRAVGPKTFNWLLFLVALALMTVPVASLIWNVVPSLTRGRFGSRRYLSSSRP